VFVLVDGKMTLTEIAPGLDLEKDILSQMDFKPEVSKDLVIMEPALFREKWDALGSTITKKKQEI
jgi:propionate CoA-transferase